MPETFIALPSFKALGFDTPGKESTPVAYETFFDKFLSGFKVYEIDKQRNKIEQPFTGEKNKDEALLETVDKNGKKITISLKERIVFCNSMKLFDRIDGIIDSNKDGVIDERDKDKLVSREEYDAFAEQQRSRSMGKLSGKWKDWYGKVDKNDLLISARIALRPVDCDFTIHTY